MAIEKVVNISVNVKGGGQAIAQTDKLNQKLKQLNATTGELKGGLKDSGNAILENGGAMGILNDLTGGLAMTVKDAVESTALFTKGTTIATTAQKLYTLVVGTTTGALKALRIALISTGLGAIVVAIGLLVAKMSEWSDATEDQITQQNLLNQSLDKTNQLYKESIQGIADITKEQVLRAKIAGKSQEEISKIEVEAEKDRYNNYLNERQRLLNLLKDRNLSAENAEKINKQLAENQKEYFNSVNADRIKDLENEFSSVDAKRQANKALLEKLAEDRQKAREEEAKKLAEYNESLAKGLNDLQIATNEAEFEQREVALENRQRQADEIAKIAESEYQSEAEAKRKSLLFAEITEQSKVNLANNTVNLLGQLAKKGSAVAKGLAIANVIRGQIESVSKIISSTAEANAKAVALSPLTGGQPFVTLNTISAGIGIAASVAGAIKAVKDINSESKSASGGNVSSGGGGASTPSAPSFNLIAGSGANQITEGLSANRRPVEAYVVSGKMTTAQSLDRNIIKDASL